MKRDKRSPLVKAAENMDWQQVVLNGGPPCFHLEDGRFCGRAERWDGHHFAPICHEFVPLHKLLADARAGMVPRELLSEALGLMDTPEHCQDDDWQNRRNAIAQYLKENTK